MGDAVCRWDVLGEKRIRNLQGDNTQAIILAQFNCCRDLQDIRLSLIKKGAF